MRKSREIEPQERALPASEPADVDVPEAAAEQRQEAAAVHPPLGDGDRPSLSAPLRRRRQGLHGVGDQHLGRDQLQPPRRGHGRAVAVRHRARPGAGGRALVVRGRGAGGPDDAVKEARPDHASHRAGAAAAAALLRGHQRGVRRAEAAPAARELLAAAAEVVALAAAVCLAVFACRRRVLPWALLPHPCRRA